MRTLEEAIALYQDERYVDAARRLQLVTQFEPENIEGWMYYGASLAKLGQTQAAVAALRQVVRLRPDEVSGYCDLAAELIAQGDRNGADAVLDQAATLDAEHPAIKSLRERLRPVAPPPAPTTDPLEARPTQVRRRTKRSRRLPKLRLRGLITDANRLPILIGLLLLLLMLTVLRTASAPRALRGELARCAQLLEQAEQARTRLSHQPGEDFDVQNQADTLVNGAEQAARKLSVTQPKLPEVRLLLGRVALFHHDSLGAGNEAMKGLALLGDAAPAASRPTGGTAGQVRAELLRLKVRAALVDGRPPTKELAASLIEDVRTAGQLSPDAEDGDLVRVLQPLVERKAGP